MCYQCIYSYYIYRITPNIGNEILESIYCNILGVDDFNELQNHTLICKDQPGWDAIIDKISEQIKEYGFNVSGEPTTSSQLLMSLIPSFINAITNINDENNDDEENNDDDIRFNKDLDNLLHNDNIDETVQNITSRYMVPIDLKQTLRFERLFQKIPLDHINRRNIIKIALKNLQLVPTSFSRSAEDTILIISQASRLVEPKSITGDVCGICHIELMDATNKLINPADNNNNLCIIYGNIYGPKCKHYYCWSCFYKHQQTVAGDSCPMCREDLKLSKIETSTKID